MRVFFALLIIFTLASPAFAAQKPTAPAKKPERPVEQIYLETEVLIDAIDQIAFDLDGIPVTGTIQGFYPNGRLAWETQWVNGKLHGVTKNYYENRRLREESTWMNGKMHGPARWYTEQGKLRGEIVYEDGKDPSAPVEEQAKDAPDGQDKAPPDKAPEETQ
jgi:hypothetical protein